MELIFRQRLDRPDKAGRAAIFGDLHWAGGHRWKIPTGVKVLPTHWQPTKSKKIYPAAPDADALNLRLTRLLTAVQGVFLKAEADRRPEASVTVAELQQALAEAGAGSRRAIAPPPPRRSTPTHRCPTLPAGSSCTTAGSRPTKAGYRPRPSRAFNRS